MSISPSPAGTPGQERMSYSSTASAATAAEFRRCRKTLPFNLGNLQRINVTFSLEKQQNSAHTLKGSSRSEISIHFPLHRAIIDKITVSFFFFLKKKMQFLQNYPASGLHGVCSALYLFPSRDNCKLSVRWGRCCYSDCAAK